MKKLLIGLLALSSLSAFSSEFDNMNIQEIYDSGYKLQAKVINSRGHVIHPGQDELKVARPGSYCVLKLNRSTSKSRILIKGRVINFELIFSSKHGALGSLFDKTVWQLVFPTNAQATKLADLKNLCNLEFEVVPREDLEEASIDFDGDDQSV